MSLEGIPPIVDYIYLVSFVDSVDMEREHAHTQVFRWWPTGDEEKFGARAPFFFLLRLYMYKGKIQVDLWYLFCSCCLCSCSSAQSLLCPSFFYFLFSALTRIHFLVCVSESNTIIIKHKRTALFFFFFWSSGSRELFPVLKNWLSSALPPFLPPPSHTLESPVHQPKC